MATITMATVGVGAKKYQNCHYSTWAYLGVDHEVPEIIMCGTCILTHVQL